MIDYIYGAGDDLVMNEWTIEVGASMETSAIATTRIFSYDPSVMVKSLSIHVLLQRIFMAWMVVKHQ